MPVNTKTSKAPTKGEKKHWKMDKKLWTRIICGVLAAIMVLSLAYSVII